MRLPSHEEACCHSPLSLSLSACVWLQRPAGSLCCSVPVPFPRGSHCLSPCSRAWQRRQRRHVMRLPSPAAACCHSPLSLSLSACVWLQRPAGSLCCSVPVPFPRGSHCLSQCARAWQRGERGHVMRLLSHAEACCHSPLSLSLSLRVCGCRGPQALSAAPYRSRFLAAPTVSLSVHAHGREERGDM